MRRAVTLPPAYLIVGKDEWQRRAAEDMLWRMLQLSRRRCLRWRGAQVVERQLAGEVEAFDLFGDERVLYIAEGELLSKGMQQYLSAYLKRRVQSPLLIVIAAATLPAAAALYRAAEEYGVLFVTETLRPSHRERMCEEWLRGQATLHGKELAPQAGRLLLRHVGVDYDLLLQELAKVAAYVGDRAVIGEGDVAAVGQVIASDTAWQLGDLILQNDMRGALFLGHRLLAGGTALIALVRQLRRQLQTAFEVATLSSPEIAERHPQLRDFMVERQRRLVDSYGYARLSVVFCSLDACELAFKDGCTDEALLFEQLVVRLGGGGAPSLTLPLGAAHHVF